MRSVIVESGDIIYSSNVVCKAENVNKKKYIMSGYGPQIFNFVIGLQRLYIYGTHIIYP